MATNTCTERSLPAQRGVCIAHKPPVSTKLVYDSSFLRTYEILVWPWRHAFFRNHSRQILPGWRNSSEKAVGPSACVNKTRMGVIGPDLDHSVSIEFRIVFCNPETGHTSLEYSDTKGPGGHPHPLE